MSKLSQSPEATAPILADTARASLAPRKAVFSEAKRKLFEKYQSGVFSDGQVFGPTITRCPLGELPPLSLVQERVWRRALATHDVPSFYNESITLHRTGDLERAVLERSITEIFRRHEAWRTTFDTVEGRPVQVIHPAPIKVDIPFVDLRRIAKCARGEEALRLATEDACRPFDLKQGPLVRALLVTLDDRTHRLFLTMHQSVTDGVSVYQILPFELAVLYRTFAAGQFSPLPDLPVQYADFAYSERRLLVEEGVLDKQLAYWQNQLGCDFRPLEWPRKYLRSAVPSAKGAIQAFTFPESIRQGLRELGHREGVTLFTTLLAGFAVLLFIYTDQQDIITGTIAPAGRKRVEVQKLLGYFLNPVPLRVDMSDDPTVRDLMKRCQELIMGALSNDDVPLEYLIDHLKFGSDPVDRCAFNTVITLAPAKSEFGAGWDQTPMDVNTGWARWDLYLELSDRPTGILARAQYRTEVFTPSAIARFLQDFTRVLEALNVNAEQHISELQSVCCRTR